MNNLFSVKWWVNMFVQVFVTMVFIYMIKKISTKYNIPFVSNVAQEV